MLVISERSSIIQNKHTHTAWHFLQFVKQGTVSHASERENDRRSCKKREREREILISSRQPPAFSDFREQVDQFFHAPSSTPRKGVIMIKYGN